MRLYLKTEYDDSWKGRFLGSNHWWNHQHQPLALLQAQRHSFSGNWCELPEAEGEFTSAVINYAFVLDQLTSSVPGLAPWPGYSPERRPGRHQGRGHCLGL